MCIARSGEPFTENSAVRELEVVGGDLHLVRDELTRLLDHLLGREDERRPADRQATAPVRVETVAAAIAVSPCSTSISEMS